ncbi:nucleoid occlusion factor SlmA [Sutterella sp.]|uniref:nucleoid occlusion factor SlmA n=1 Tax=Sutterella sp. TaxID=1981025 RepID=UPI0026DF908C|nr:nucleoid occlusion factor SlmA [Sutterella sp.]MDO5531153.1 nucleoid occlusion factor SlmA [Sutterella sp.]
MTEPSAGAPAEKTQTAAEPKRPVVRLPRPGRAHRNRRADILQTLAELLQDPNCERITTAQIARKVNLSEGALYRYFPSKGAMFDALIEFIETSLLDLFARIREDKSLSAVARVQVMITVMLDFADANRGLARVMTGHALVKEDPRLSERMNHIIDKLEMGLRQAYREAVLARELPADFNADGRASLAMNWVLGRLLRFVVTDFRTRPNGVSAVALTPFFE